MPLDKSGLVKAKPKNKKAINTKIRNFHEIDNARIITVIFVQPQYIQTYDDRFK